MEVHVRGRNLKIDDAIETHIRKRLERIDRYLPNTTEVHVDLSRDHARSDNAPTVAQITIRHARGAILRAEERADGDLTAVVNEAIEKIYRQIQRFKGKRIQKGRERFSASLEEIEGAEDIPVSGIVYTDDETPELGVERRKSVIMTVMTEAEAIEQMELLGHTFFIYQSADNGALNVLYKRRGGGYGILMPKTE